MTYNVLHTNPAVEDTHDAIAAGEPDLVLLQETTRRWEEALRGRFGRAYPHVVVHHSHRGAAGFLALSRTPVREDALLPPAADAFPAHRLVVDTAIGPLQVLHVHLRPMYDGGDWVRGYFTTPPIRRREIEAYWATMRPELPTIVAGDFNEEGNGLALGFLAERGVRRVDPGAPTWRWEGNYRGNDVKLRLALDHIAHDQRLRATAARVIDGGGSDHLPVVADLTPALLDDQR